MELQKHAIMLLDEFKNRSYLYGPHVMGRAGIIAKKQGDSAVLVRGTFPGSDGYAARLKKSLEESGVKVAGEFKGARPNAPKEDLARITGELKYAGADLTVSMGGGSTIDTVKAAEVLVRLGGSIEDYFGTGLVTEALKKSGKKLNPHMAIQTAASSAAHLTRYSNITDLAWGQKKLIVDNAIVPQCPVFDYSVTYKAPKALTTDGALDGIAHMLEVLYGAHGKENYLKVKEIAETGISLIVKSLPEVIEKPDNKKARDALCLGTDLGGYAIMVGGTNGGHLTSFSLVDILSHGRACAILNPYYTVFFAPAIEDGLRAAGNIYKKYGYSNASFDSLSGSELGVEAAKAMFAFSDRVGFPRTLSQVAGFTDNHIKRALSAAKNPQLKMKLQNMPVPLNPEDIDIYMKPVLESAKTGDLGLIKQFTTQGH